MSANTLVWAMAQMMGPADTLGVDSVGVWLSFGHAHAVLYIGPLDMTPVWGGCTGGMEP